MLKAAVWGVTLVLVSPLAGLYLIGAALFPARRDGWFQGFSQLLSLGPGLPGDYLRRGFYRLTLAKSSRACSIGFGTILATPEVTIGDGVYIGPFCNIAHATIGDDVMLGSNVHLVSGRRAHGMDRLDVPMRLQERHHEVLQIGRDSWVGNGAIVMADLGAQVVVGAGSVVVRPVPPRHVVAGNPARTLRVRGAEARDAAR